MHESNLLPQKTQRKQSWSQDDALILHIHCTINNYVLLRVRNQSLTSDDLYLLNKITSIAGKVCGTQVPNLEDLFMERNNQKSKCIVNDTSHPLASDFEKLRSGRYKSLTCKTNRFLNSFIPSAIRQFNANFKRQPV